MALRTQKKNLNLGFIANESDEDGIHWAFIGRVLREHWIANIDSTMFDDKCDKTHEKGLLSPRNIFLDQKQPVIWQFVATSHKIMCWKSSDWRWFIQLNTVGNEFNALIWNDIRTKNRSSIWNFEIHLNNFRPHPFFQLKQSLFKCKFIDIYFFNTNKIWYSKNQHTLLLFSVINSIYEFPSQLSDRQLFELDGSQLLRWNNITKQVQVHGDWHI